MFAVNNHIQRARLLLQQGRLRDAEKEIGFALHENPDDAEALLLLAECKVDEKQYDEAIRLLHNCIALEPDYHRNYYLLAFCHYRMNNRGEAVSYIQKAIALYPYASAYYGLYAYLMLDMRWYREALEKANEGLAIYAEDLTCLNARTQALFRLKNNEEAYETIREALAINPEDDFTHTNVGWHYLEKGKHKTSRQHFREALRINPNNARARQGYKESLKAKLLPYKWMLMFSLWLSSKSKQTRWITVIAIWASVQLLSRLSTAGGADVVAYILIGIYLLFVIFSWVGASMANMVLLFSSESKYVLTKTEKQVAAVIASLLFVAAFTALLGDYIPTIAEDNQYMAALVFLTLVLPVSRFEYLHLVRRKKLVLIYSIVLIAVGVISAVGLLAGITGMMALMTAYFIGLALYTWCFAFL
ncbi:tetratricopeptide repeat protein [Ilyomonas limi]|uniref:Tetratricopeptide repeat protein n=1 Tax=Ilyomonas limi TaxID=2575867 RepID=A0A4U3L125_9BACT|nr:tetratricopeptide repeat protein [Ilyomonas limi]TKK68550.1 tetratricopeptide repeat protein [Ilyomonas limi]